MTGIELNLALIPEPALSDRCVLLSQRLAEATPALVTLSVPESRLAIAPHLTIYQVAIPVMNYSNLSRVITSVASKYRRFSLQATAYAYNQNEGSLEIGYAASNDLIEFQDYIVADVGLLRTDNRTGEDHQIERDPAGNPISELLKAPGRLGENIRKTGYGEVGNPATGGLFRPHITLNWFEPGTPFDLANPALEAIEHMHGSFSAFGVYVLGPKGTCPQLLASHPMH